MGEEKNKKLVIYYSLTGNTKFIADSIGFSIGADMLEIKPKKEIKNKGILRYFWGGKQVILEEKPELLPMKVDLEDYDLIFIGTPVWAGHYNPVFRTFLDKHKIKDKKIAIYASCKGNCSKALEKLKEELKENEIIDELCFTEPINDSKEDIMVSIKKWAQEIDIRAKKINK